MLEYQKEIVSQVEIISISKEFEGQRLDNYLINRLKGIPKSRIYKAIRKGEVRVNKGRAKAEYKIKQDDRIRIPPFQGINNRQKTVFVGERLEYQIKNSILYEDDRLLVINKPSGLAVHGGSGLKLGLIEALREIFPLATLELVHRLDRDTSGCIMVAKKRSMLKQLHEMLREGKLEKIYHTLVFGKWPKHKQVVDVPLEKNTLQSGERIVKVSDSGKRAKTLFRVLQRYKDYTLLEVKPVTGRTHQIRVHTQHAGHSIVGDSKYAATELNNLARKKGFNRLFLHAAELKLQLPDCPMLHIKAPLDIDLSAILEKL